MRLTMFVIPAFVLSACAMAPQQSATSVASAEPAAVFEVPMDPGLIRCSALANPNALAAAIQWTIGHARAGVLAGRVTNVPDEANLAQQFAAYCPANPDSTVRAAATQWGLAS
jgi:hypothetical protein